MNPVTDANGASPPPLGPQPPRRVDSNDSIDNSNSTKMGFFTRKKKEGPKPAPIEVKKIQRPTDAYRARLFKSKGIPYISVAEADSDDDVKYRRVDRNGFELVFTDNGIYRKEIIVDQTFIEDKYLPYYRIGMVCLLLVFCQWGLKAFFFTTMTVFLLKVYFYKVAWVLPISWQKSLGFLQDYEDRFHSVASEPGKFENFERKRK